MSFLLHFNGVRAVIFRGAPAPVQIRDLVRQQLCEAHALDADRRDCRHRDRVGAEQRLKGQTLQSFVCRADQEDV